MNISLSTRALYFRYATGFSVGPVDLQLGPGTLHLEGPNGAGKTTLMRLQCGGLRPSSGEVRVCGRDPAREAGARALVAWSPAEPDLPDFLTVDEAWQTMAALRRAPRWDGRPFRQALANLDRPALDVVAGWIEGWRRDRIILLTSHQALPGEADQRAELLPGEALRVCAARG